jgi:hypothetical protein
MRKTNAIACHLPTTDTKTAMRSEERGARETPCLSAGAPGVRGPELADNSGERGRMIDLSRGLGTISLK